MNSSTLKSTTFVSFDDCHHPELSLVIRSHYFVKYLKLKSRIVVRESEITEISLHGINILMS